jgi:hypothetical protein
MPRSQSHRTALLILANVLFWGILLGPVLFMMARDLLTTETTADGWPVEILE